MSGPSRSHPNRFPSVSDDRNTSPVRRNLCSEPSDASSVSATSSHGTSSPKGALPTASPTLAPPPQETRYRRTARMQVIPPNTEPYGLRTQGTPSPIMGSCSPGLHPDDPYAAPPTRVTDRYAWQQHLGSSTPRTDGAGPSRPVTGIPVGHGLTSDQLQGLRNMASDLRGLMEETEHQANLLFQVSDTAHRLSENAVKMSMSTEETHRTVRRLVSVCLVMGTLLAVILFKMLMDFLR